MFESCPIVQLSDNNTDRVSGLTVRSTASECLVDGSGDPSYILVGTSFLLESLALVDGSGDPSYILVGIAFRPTSFGRLSGDEKTSVVTRW